MGGKNQILKELLKKSWLNLLLFLLTCSATIFAGALQRGARPELSLEFIKLGLPFSFSLMTILLSHEIGHYVMAKREGMEVTLPYFIPAPSFIGTFGAFIKMKSPIKDRNSLVDIGASGPIVGAIVSVPFIVFGLKMSKVMPLEKPTSIALGSSLLMTILERIVIGDIPEGKVLLLHPFAFAGWIGLFVTSMNLLPVGQLDGGHISYALFGKISKKLSIFTMVVLLLFGILFWQGWLIWGMLLVFVGIGHPPLLCEWEPLNTSRKIFGLLAFFLFILTFVPAPFTIPKP